MSKWMQKKAICQAWPRESLSKNPFGLTWDQGFWCPRGNHDQDPGSTAPDGYINNAKPVAKWRCAPTADKD